MQFVPLIAIILIGLAYSSVMKVTHYSGGNPFVDTCCCLIFLGAFGAEAVCFINYGISLILLLTTVVYLTVLLIMGSVSPYRKENKSSGNYR